MSLILKEEAPNSVPTPPAGKGTIFLSDTDVLTVKLANGSTQGFPTVGGSNTQVFFNDQGALQGNANFTFNKTTGLLTTPLLTVQGNATVDGDLVVNGNITYINVTTFAVEDPIIELGGGPNGNALTSNDGYDRGTLLHYYTSAPVDAFMGWDTSNAEFAMGSNVTVAANVITFNTLGNLRVGGLKTDNLYYSNGNPWDLQQPAGSNTQLQFNNQNDFGASANLTFDTATNNLSVSGNVNVSSNVLAQNLNANGVVSATGNISGGNITTGGILTATGNIGGGNLNSVGVVSATGNVIGGNITTVGQLVSTKGSGAPIVVSSTSLVANLNADLLDGFNTDGAATANTIPVRNADGNLVANYFIGNGSQLTGIDATSIQNGNSNVKVEANSNVNISVAGTANVIQVSATGVKVTGTLESTGNANVNFLTATGNITGNHLQASNTLSVTGNANVGNLGVGGEIITLGNVSGGNLTTGGVVTATGNVSGGNLTTGGALSVTGNANIGNIGTAGLVTATGNVSGGNLTTGGVVTATGNVSGGNLTTGGALSVTGNANVGNIGATGGVFTTVAGTLTTASQPNITSLGTLTSLAVTGNVTSGNVSGGNLVSANYLTGTLTTAAQPNITSVGSLSSLTVTGNANAGNIGAAAGVFTTIAGSLTTASQPNITSTGTLTSLSVTGNTTSGNVYANSGTIGASLLTGTLTTAAQPNVTSLGTLSSLVSSGNIQSNANVVTNLIQGRTTGVTITATGTNQNISLVPTGTGTVDVANARITSVGTPTASTDAATKQYVDDVAQGLNIHDSVQAATPDTLANITSGTITYNNGTGGVNANLVTTGSFNLIDGVNVQTSGTRILVKNQANAVQNGIYTWANSTTIVRATDFNSVPEVEAGDFVFVTGGTLYDNTGWVQTATVTTIGTDNIEWTQFSGAGTYQAGTGLTLTGSTFSISNTAVTATSYGNGDRVATFTVNNQGQLTAASNVAITANAANLTGTTLNSGIVTSSLTSVGTLGTLNVSGNANVGNIGGSAGVFTTVAGTLTTASQPNITSLGTLTSASVTGNVTAGNVYANSGTIGASLLTGTLTTASQPNITSLGTLSSLTVSGNASAGNLNTAGKVVANTLESNVATGTAPFTVVSTTQVANLNVATAGTAGTVTTAAQPNITSVGTLTSLGVNGNITAANVTANTGIFTGNANGLSSVQAGNIVGTTLSSTVVTSSLTTVGTLGSLGVSGNITAANVTANTGIFAGNGSGLTALNASNISSGTLTQARLANASVTLGSTALTLGSTVTTVAGLSSVTSTTFVGALTGAATTAGTVTTAAQPNITSVGTLSGLTVSSTITGSVSGSAATAGTVTTAAQPNITSVGTLSSLAVTGNVTAGNVYANSGTGGFTTLSASGNITGANVIVSGTTNATSTTTGALTVAGGIGVAGNSYVGNTTVKSNLAYVAPNGANTITSQMLNGGTLAWSGNAGQLFSITDSMSGNIFSVNDVSGIPMIAVDAGGNIYFATSGGYVAYGVTSSITAAGSTQGTATSLTRPINIVSTVSASTGVVLPATVAGMRMIVVNNGANALNVYPPSGGAINSGATNAAYSQPVGSRIEFIASSTTQWYTLNATFA